MYILFDEEAPPTMFEWLAKSLSLHFILLAALRALKILKTSNFRCLIYDAYAKLDASGVSHSQLSQLRWAPLYGNDQWLRHRIHRKLWSLVFWYSNCQRKTKCKVRLIKQVTSFVEGASIAHRKVRGYIFQERVGCEQKPNNTYGYMAMIKLVYS